MTWGRILRFILIASMFFVLILCFPFPTSAAWRMRSGIELGNHRYAAGSRDFNELKFWNRELVYLFWLTSPVGFLPKLK